MSKDELIKEIKELAEGWIDNNSKSMTCNLHDVGMARSGQLILERLQLLDSSEEKKIKKSS